MADPFQQKSIVLERKVIREFGKYLPVVADWMLYSHALLRIHITGGRWGLLLPLCFLITSGPATRDFQSSISVEALFRKYHLDVQGLLHQQLLWSPPSGSGGDCPMHAPLQPTSPSSPSHRHPGVPSVSSPVSAWSLQCRPGHSSRGYDILEVMYPSPWYYYHTY